MQMARRGDVPVFNLLPGPGPLPGGDLSCGLAAAHFASAPRCQAPQVRGLSAKNIGTIRTTRPTTATTAVTMIPVVVPSSCACDVLISGCGCTFLPSLLAPPARPVALMRRPAARTGMQRWVSAGTRHNPRLKERAGPRTRAHYLARCPALLPGSSAVIPRAWRFLCHLITNASPSRQRTTEQDH
jgi:hypothetical protein